jgi:hypothetical protein
VEFKIGLVEWLKIQALSSNPSTAKKKTTENVVFIYNGILFSHKEERNFMI